MANSRGRLAEAFTGTSSKITDLGFSYTARGEVATVYESTPHSGGYYQVSASYWEHGGLKALTAPVIPTIYYGASDGSGLDGEGRVTKVTVGTGTPNPVTGVTYTTTNAAAQPIGSVAQVVYGSGTGSGDTDNFQYDLNTGRMTKYTFNVGTTPQTVVGNLNWNQNGSLGSLGITDQLNSLNTQTCTYSYDDLGRMATANCGASIWNQAFSFDPFGNITKTVPGGGTGVSFQPTYSHSKNQYQSLPGCTPSYDANGFLQNDCTHTYTWDAAGNPLSIDSTTLTYDALGRLCEQATAGNYAQVVYSTNGGKLELMNGQTLRKALISLPMGGQAVYQMVSGQVTLTYYRHPDWLGSARLATTPARTLYFDTAYAPYGENYAGATGTGGAATLSFTGQNQDTASGLYDFMFREYNQSHGRWAWPDPAGLGAVSMENPQTWNRYAYVANNPLTAVDPLGLFREDAVGIGNCTMNAACVNYPDPYSVITDARANLFVIDFGEFWIRSTTEEFKKDNGLLDPANESFQNYLDFVDDFSPVGDLSGTSGIPISPECLTALAGRTSAFRRAQTNWSAIHNAAFANGVDPRVLAAIGVRETGFQNITGDYGHGHGVFQIDDRWNPASAIKLAYDIPSAANYAGAKIGGRTSTYLAQGFDYDLALAGAVRDYNGTGGIPTRALLNTGYAGYLDLGTTHNNYVSDVLAMAANCF